MDDDEKLTPKGVAYEWFREEAQEVTEDYGAVARGWDAAWGHFDSEGGLEPWKGWVRQMIRKAISKAKSSPTGLWITLLQAGPEVPLKASGKLKGDERAQAEHLRTQELLRDMRDGVAGHPPLSYGVRAIQEGRDPKEIYALWEAAGSPPMDEFPYPSTL